MLYLKLTYLCRVGSSAINIWTGLFQIAGCLVSFYYHCFIEIPIFNANGVDPDQTPRSAASDLGLHCLQLSLLWDARHKWVKNMFHQSVIGTWHYKWNE